MEDDVCLVPPSLKFGLKFDGNWEKVRELIACVPGLFEHERDEFPRYSCWAQDLCLGEIKGHLISDTNPEKKFLDDFLIPSKDQTYGSYFRKAYGQESIHYPGVEVVYHEAGNNLGQVRKEDLLSGEAFPEAIVFCSRASDSYYIVEFTFTPGYSSPVCFVADGLKNEAKNRGMFIWAKGCLANNL